MADEGAEVRTVVPSGSDRPSDDALSPQLRAARSVGGKVLIVVLSVIVAAFFALNLVSARKNQKDAKRARALSALVNDAAVVTQTWAPTADGLTATFVVLDPASTAHIDDVRSYLKTQRIQHLRADYSDVRFEGRPLPGRPELESGTENLKLNVRYTDVSRGGRLTWIGTDSDRDIMKAALTEWSDAVKSK